MLSSQNVFLIIFVIFSHRSISDSFQTQILEARLLYPSGAYKDVQLFHYTLPPKVSFASFQYKANGSDHCPHKTIDVYLQYGSYPVVNLQNSSFPDHFVVKHLFLNHVTLLSNTMSAIINITNPLAGDWYAAAFLIENTDRIAPIGLFTPCFSWLSSSVKFYSEQNIINILQNTTRLGQKIYGLQSYRFYGLENNWVSRIFLNNCSNSKNGKCAVLLTARAMGIPFSKIGSDSYVVNCTETDSCVLQFIPAVENWNYISIQSLGPELKFDLVVETEDCNRPISTESGEKQYLEILSKLNFGDILSLNFDTRHKSSLIFTSQSLVRQIDASEVINFENYDSFYNESCWSRIPLDRLSLAKNLAFEFNLPPEEEYVYPLIFNISTYRYTFARFEILPIVDIGGTLVIELAISTFVNQSRVNVSVLACLSYGVRSTSEDSECIQGIPLSVDTSLIENSSTTLFVPYPAAGIWYLRLQSQCYSLKTDNSSIFSVACDKIPIFLRIRSTPCVLGRCGAYGKCYQYVSGGLIFSTCDCIAGWKGWGCSDNSTAYTNSELMIDVLFLTLSNLLFLPAIILSVYRRYYTEAFVYFATMLSSSFYHACDAEVYSYCIVRLNVLQFCDFYSGILSVWITVIAMAKLPNSVQSFAHMSGAIGIAFSVEYNRTELWVFMLPTGIGIAVLLTSWIRRCYKKKLCYPEKKIWLFYLLPGACLALAGLIIYAFFETKNNYPYVHSAWHAAIALSVLFLLPKRKPCLENAPRPTTSHNYIGDRDGVCPDGSNPVGTTRLLVSSF